MFRRMLLNEPKLPNKYIECEYIENTSTAYIDTGIIDTLTISFDMEIQLTSNAPKQGILGKKRGSPPYYFNCYSLDIGDTNNFVFRFGSFVQEEDIHRFTTTDPLAKNRVLIEMGVRDVPYDDRVTIGNEKLDMSINSASIDGSLDLFALNKDEENTHCKMKLFKCRAIGWHGTIRNYIPCLEIKTGLYGLYDTITKKFYTSPNGVPFNGKVKNIEDNYMPVEYIENTSNAYIDTGINPDKTVKVEIDFEITKNQPSTCFLCGSRLSDNRGAFNTLIVNNVFIDDLENYNTGRINTGIKVLGRHNYVKYDRNITIDGITKTHPASLTTTNNFSIYLFNINNGGNLSNGSYFKVYAFKITKGNQIQRDFIPCLEISSGLYGLYDKIENKFYKSPNSIPFVGPEESRNIYIMDAYGMYHNPYKYVGNKDGVIGVAILNTNTNFLIDVNESTDLYLWDSDINNTIIPNIPTYDNAVDAYSNGYDGEAYTITMVDTKGTVEAARYCRSVSFKNGKTGYLGSLAQWKIIYDNIYAVNNALTRIKAKILSDEEIAGSTGAGSQAYWTSTQCNAEEAYAVRFGIIHHLPQLDSFKKRYYGYKKVRVFASI